MTENEAIKQAVRCVVGACDETCPHYWSDGVCHGYEEIAKGLEKALEEIQQYRAIGTVEEFKALKEKEERFDRNIKMFNEIGLEIRVKAIDEFAELLKGNLIRKYANATLTQQYVALQVTDWCNEIAEQMKAGGE